MLHSPLNKLVIHIRGVDRIDLSQDLSDPHGLLSEYKGDADDELGEGFSTRLDPKRK